jgi:hypothetical protein
MFWYKLQVVTLLSKEVIVDVFEVVIRTILLKITVSFFFLIVT